MIVISAIVVIGAFIFAICEIVANKDKKIDDQRKEIENKDKTIDDQLKEIENKNKTIDDQNKEIEENEKYVYTNEIQLELEFYKGDSKGSITSIYEIPESSSYRICVFGAKAKQGGYGGKQCGEYYFEKGSKITFYYEGREAGGKGGKDCGFWSKGDGYDGGGLSMASYNNEILIVAGGGGGDSEDNKNKGGDFQKDGEGIYGGKGATKYGGGKAGDINSQDGKKLKGGDGASKGDQGKYCGGGGGNGYYGGGAGDYGSEGKQGGGGGGSNFCDTEKAKKCFNNDNEINWEEQSGYAIYMQIK